MSILIKDMEMPKNCYNCQFAVDGTCVAMQPISTRNWREKETTNFCPLIPIPDHGDLIEKEVAIGVVKMAIPCMDIDSLLLVSHQLQTIDDAPIVIPAERSE